MGIVPVTLSAQFGPNVQASVGTIPNINVGGGYMDAQFAQLDFAQKLLEEQKKQSDKWKKQRQQLVDTGTVSVLDLQAPLKAITEFNRGEELLQQQKPKDAIAHLEKAVAAYPKFVSAHNNLGIAYEDLDDRARAKTELETAAQLDTKFAASYLNLGRLALAQKDFDSAAANLEKASALRPTDPKILIVLAYAQNSNHQYNHVIGTAARVHAVPHPGLANVHYLAASAAIALKDFPTVQKQLELFLQEDPTNPLAPTAHYNLNILASYRDQPATSSSTVAHTQVHPAGESVVKTFPNSDALKNALAGLDADEDTCTDCAINPNDDARLLAKSSSPDVPSVSGVSGSSSGVWRIRDVIDEVAVFFAVTNGAKLVNDLAENDLTVRDDNKAPAKIFQFASQSKLPLHLGLLIDTSGSLQPRFDFEKKAAGKFIESMLRNSGDLAFVAGFSNDINVTQDFSPDAKELATSIDKLSINGGTAIWDAVSFACWKLAAFPENERVAKVLVVLTDGEDNASKSTLKRAIRDAETTGVTVYTISTRDYEQLHKYGMTDADKVLQALSERTGGEAMFPGEMTALDKAFAKLRDVIRSRYLIAYKPANLQSDGHYRKITITATRNGRHLKVHARQGYYAPFEGKS